MQGYLKTCCYAIRPEAQDLSKYMYMQIINSVIDYDMHTLHSSALCMS